MDYEATRREFIRTAGLLGGGALVLSVLPGRAYAAPAPLQTSDAAGVPLDNRMTTDDQWGAFLRGQDLLWKRLPTVWHEGPFLGDGLLGTGVYKEPGQNQIRFTVQHAEVQDHRPQFGSAFGVCRLPVGHLTLEPVGTISSVDWRLGLWNAELTGTVTTGSGKLAFQVFIRDQILVASVTASGSEQVRWVFHPEEAISPAAASKPLPDGYTKNPPWTTRTTGDIKQVIQPLSAGGQTATAYREIAGPATGQRLLYVSVAHSYPGTTAEATSLNRVQGASATVWADYMAGHHMWWHSYYRRSFLSLPDQRLQAFYWIQLYKAASGTRAGGPVMATTGPWLETTPWPAVWWNLNVQLEYWLIQGSNHPELDAITSTLDKSRQQLISNVPSEYESDSSGLGRSSDMFCNRSVPVPGSGTPEIGDLPWALHNVWLSYRHAMDDAMLRDVLFPILRRSVNYYLHFLTTDSSGKMHLPPTFSPEYGVNAPDCNYDLALLRWGCQTLLEAVARLGITDSLAGTWQRVLDNLTPYPTDSNGFMIGAGVPFAQSHRHYSHLLMVFPLSLVNWDQSANRTLIQTSVDHWIGLNTALRGFSYSGATSLYAHMGQADKALTYLTKFFDPGLSYPIRANTMYTESGPVVETPLSGAQAVHDMLCQSWGGLIRVFPAVPAGWPDVTLHDFRTQGAFLISASRTAGVTRFIRVRSLAGELCRVKQDIAPYTLPTLYQAESASLSKGVVESNHEGFTGTGFVNLDNVAGSYVQFTVNASAAGPATLVFRYANGTIANRPLDIAVNGSTAAQAKAFPSTGSWNNWQTVAVSVQLQAGTNTVRATSAAASGGPNLDRLAVQTSRAPLTVTLDDGTAAAWRDLGYGAVEIDLPKDREALIHAAGATPALTIAPVPVSTPGAAWGLPT
ncbi:carbohydrate-binding protein [Streptomyces sp. NPDC006733]|uniref:glycosyl hydrolase family 95 catalytic domain-containing protein n=1 Tax=Streptomyces sp. NPDC006733 TaxID=3155460 RepID=UPI00340D83B7